MKNINYKMLTIEDLFEDVQVLLFDHGFRWSNQSETEKRIVPKTEAGIGIILRNKVIYSAYTISKHSSWSLSPADVINMKDFIEEYSKPLPQSSILDLNIEGIVNLPDEILAKISSAKEKNKKTIILTKDEILELLSSSTSSNGKITIPTNIAENLYNLGR